MDWDLFQLTYLLPAITCLTSVDFPIRLRPYITKNCGVLLFIVLVFVAEKRLNSERGLQPDFLLYKKFYRTAIKKSFQRLPPIPHYSFVVAGSLFFRIGFHGIFSYIIGSLTHDIGRIECMKSDKFGIKSLYRIQQ